MHIKTIRIRMAVMLFTAIVGFNAFSASAYAQDQETVVKVAYFDMGQYYQEDASENITSYDRDYLDKLEEYSSLRK